MPSYVFVCTDSTCKVEFEARERTHTICPECGGPVRRRWTAIPHSWDIVAAP